ncbi:SprT-like family-domain-containing protein [Fomitopsis serialis]|uniref:SprT-like family-domain-containing protein n=1 Tax=Fomitopsis serialis TaxID=139415 RepID=UPI0020076712|nr:SprT-like family-domain-containing protein [Neoantrodia serialis]KAH9921399.1 SprT-like family-domain-containing protein [Neoantrodia serialis]
MPSISAPSTPALEAAEQQRRERYANTFFDEMNRLVFGHGLPSKTELKWSKRLLTTAGKANWHRSREGVDSTRIDLAVKILTSDERIRNTLSHEMCHLASWIISDAPTENHGDIFQEWAKKVMRARPDIEVTTKHNYEIEYKYEWKCQQCNKIYGRHSKSINPEECVCGACRVGKLIPLFTTVARAPKTPRSQAGSAMASVRGRAFRLRGYANHHT